MAAIAAYIFVVLAAVLVLFQLSLALGAPWGHLTQGGSHPGRLPAANRLVAAVSALLVAAFVIIVLGRVGSLIPDWQNTLRPWVWVVVGFGALSLLANVASRSRAERMLRLAKLHRIYTLGGMLRPWLP